jgi:uncharacterized membrane protein
MRKLVHVLAVCCAGIISGAQYVVSFDYNPAGVAASFYTQKMQYAIHHIGTPLFGMLIASTVLCFLAGALYLKDSRRTSFLLIGAGFFLLAGALVTAFGNIPLLEIMDTWSAESPPGNWLETAERWYMFHTVRIGVDIVGLCLAVLSTFSVGADRDTVAAA